MYKCYNFKCINYNLKYLNFTLNIWTDPSWLGEAADTANIDPVIDQDTLQAG